MLLSHIRNFEECLSTIDAFFLAQLTYFSKPRFEISLMKLAFLMFSILEGRKFVELFDWEILSSPFAESPLQEDNQLAVVLALLFYQAMISWFSFFFLLIPELSNLFMYELLFLSYFL